jgi:hypothetical protein
MSAISVLPLEDLNEALDVDCLTGIARQNIVSTISERVLTALEAALSGTPGLPAGHIDRDRFEPVSRDECPHLNISPEVEPHEQGPTLPVLDAALLVQLELSVSGRPLSTLADPIRSAIHKRLMADRTLGGISYDIRSVGVGWDGAAGEIGVVRLRYRVLFRTSQSDLTLPI